MAEYNAPASLVTPGGTIVFNGASTPKLLHDATVCSGLDQAPIRATVEDKPVTDGGIVHPFYKGAREVTLGGSFVVDAISDRNTLEAELVAALDSILRADGTYEWTPDGMTLHSITARCDIPVICSFDSSGIQKYQFGLVAADPTITVA